MEEKIITFSANEQGLQKTGGISHYASDTVSYVKAVFDLGENWQGFDEVRAVFKTSFDTRSAVLNSLGECDVPFEILMYKAVVRVNLVGSIYTEEEVTDRLTTYSVEALTIDEDVPISGDSSVPITPSEYEQFVANVANDANRAETGATSAEASASNAESEAESALASAQASEASALRASGHAQNAQSAETSARAYAQNAQNYATGAENAKDDAIDARDEIRSMRANAETLEPNQSATASYSNGVLTLGIPKGQKGDTGDTGSSAGFGTVSASVDDSVGTPSVEVTTSGEDTAKNFAFAFHNLKGAKGDKGDTGTVPDLDLILPTDTASGDIASITDGQSVVPVKSLKVTLEPIQSGSGTPSPDNVRPISGRTECVTERCGKNLLDPQTKTEFNTNTWRWHYSDGYVLKKDKTYNFSWGNKDNNSFNIYLYIADFDTGANYNTGNNSVSYTPTEDIKVKFQAYYSGGIPTDAVFQLELGSTATDYEPYQGTTYTTTLGRTVYGGTLDVVSGELVVEAIKVKASDCNISLGGTSDSTKKRAYFYGLPNAVKNIDPTLVDGLMRCNVFEATTANRTYTKVEGVSVSNNSNGVYAYKDDLQTVADWQTFIEANDMEFTYTLAEPITIQLSPQTVSLLHGNNNVWSDGSVEVTYNADVGLYIDKKLGTSGTRTLSMTRTLAKSETDDTKSDNIQLAED